MGPTNIALVELFRADQALREAQSRLESTSKNVKIQKRRVADESERLRLAQQKLKEAQAHQGNLDLDIKSRDQHIEKLRTQQSNAKNDKEYRALLVEINTLKADKVKVEDESLKSMEAIEKLSGEAKTLAAAVEADTAKLKTMEAEIDEKIRALTAEIVQLKIPRDAAAAKVPPKALEYFEKMAERWEGEAMSALAKPNPRYEEYICTACNMNLVVDVYNKLHSRDDMVLCPSCRRMLYIPEDMPKEVAVNQKKPSSGKSSTASKKIVRRPATHWSESDFRQRADELQKPGLIQGHGALLDRLRSGGISSVKVHFNAPAANKASYHVFIDGYEQEVLRVFYDGDYFVNWKAFEVAQDFETLRLCREQFKPFVKDTSQIEGSYAKEDQYVGAIDVVNLASAVFEVASKSKANASSTPNPTA